MSRGGKGKKLFYSEALYCPFADIQTWVNISFLGVFHTYKLYFTPQRDNIGGGVS